MLRAVGLALVFVVGVATPAEAGGNLTDGGRAIAAQQGRQPARAAQHWDGGQAVAAERGALAATAPRSLRGRGYGARWQVVDDARGRRRLSPERRQRQDNLVLPWRRQGRSTLTLPLTERWAVGVGYRRVLGEDLWQEFADIGSVDYESHNVLLRAHWRF
jgi:hypothetical protein